ncbi:MAG: hypothetical protein QOE86_1182 [Solirubrobacteraceae bacterium]|jgi:hypothetical protein|nr:hypothetical protein [Solirubrobacteraceae bacterium]
MRGWTTTGQPPATERADCTGGTRRHDPVVSGALALQQLAGNRSARAVLARTPEDPVPSRGGADTAAPQMEIENGRVKLFRAVGPREAADIIRSGDFFYSPSGAGKYFAFTRQDAVNAGKALYPDRATIVETSVPRAFVPAEAGLRTPVHHPHIPARPGDAVMIEGETYVFYDPKAGGWSLHADDGAIEAMASQKLGPPKIVDSSFPVIGEPAPGAARPAATPGEVETLAPESVKENYVPEVVAENEAMVVRPGRYIAIGGALYAVMWIGGALFLVNDVIKKGPIEGTRDWGITAILTHHIAEGLGVGMGVASVAMLVLFMPSDQAGDAERIAKAEAIDSLIHQAFPGVVSEKKLLCVGACTAGNREIMDGDRYAKLYAKVSALAENAWQIDDDPVRVARRKVIEEAHRHDAERDLDERRELDEELAGYRQAMHRRPGFYVEASVGEDGRNDLADVRRAAARLKDVGFLDAVTDDPDVVAEAIWTYQSMVVKLPRPDGRIDPRGKTEAALRTGRRISMALPGRGT